MIYQEIISTCYSGDGGEKLQKAEAFLQQHGDLLLQDKTLQRHLLLVKEAVLSLDRSMAELDMGKVCSICAAKPGGGCCSAYMGNENSDALLLLMNLLHKIPVRQVCQDGVECCFLGDTGCILLLKPIFCLNYLCKQIKTSSTAEQLQTLEQKTGVLLTAQGKLEQSVIRILVSAP